MLPQGTPLSRQNWLWYRVTLTKLINGGGEGAD